MWQDAPLSKYQALLGVVLVERQDTNEKSLLNLDASLLNYAVAVTATICDLPFFLLLHQE
jgi:hypothetical protein